MTVLFRLQEFVDKNVMEHYQKPLSKILILSCLITGGYAFPQKRLFPVVELSQSLISAEVRPSLASRISLLPIAFEAEKKLLEKQLIEDLLT